MSNNNTNFLNLNREGKIKLSFALGRRGPGIAETPRNATTLARFKETINQLVAAHPGKLRVRVTVEGPGIRGGGAKKKATKKAAKKKAAKKKTAKKK